MDYTTNLSLKKPASSDPVKISDFNENTDVIDGLAVDFFSGLIDEPEEKDYPLVKLPFAGKINSISVKTSAGTATCYFKINSEVIGEGISASDEGATAEYSSSNSFAVSDKLSFGVSGNDSSADLEFHVWYTRS